MLFRSAHGHLQADRFDADRDAVVDRAVAAGLSRLLIPGWDVASSLAGAAIAAQIGWARVAIGVHPSAADLASDERSSLLARVADSHISAVGETGIDTKRYGVPLAVQRANLDAHLAVALEHGKPLILHCRSAAGSDLAQRELIAALRSAGFGDGTVTRAFAGRVPFILHSASGSAAYIDEALALGGGVSISGLAFRPEEGATGEWVREVPADRLMHFQILDSDRRVLGNQLTWIYPRPGETKSCVGCHEDPSMSPPALNNIAFTQDKPAEITPIDDVRSTADYRRAVTGRVLRRIVLDAGPA